ncbi:MAG: hypothetical protein ABFR65_13445 [Pseudomonadota bacterium]
MSEHQTYLEAFQGSFTSALRWPNLDALWERLRRDADGDWYIYAIGEAPPAAAVGADALNRFITQIDALLRKEHDEDYCGIVYADDLNSPTFVKIYDPNNLGVSCGYSDNPPLPGWVLSKIPPVDLPSSQVIPKNRKRWWRSLFGA